MSYDDSVHKETYKGYEIEIFTDTDAQDPREDDNIGVMLCYYKRYSLGDKDHGYTKDNFNSWAEIKKQLKKDGAVVILPLGLLDHGGITMQVGSRFASDSDGWDSGQVGFIYCTKAKLIKEYGKDTKATRAKAEKYLQGEVETYDNFLTGNVYGYIITDPNGNDDDSCWGFSGDYDDDDYGALKEARSVVDSILKNTKEFSVGLQSYVVINVRAKDVEEATKEALGILASKVEFVSAGALRCQENLLPTTRATKITKEK